MLRLHRAGGRSGRFALVLIGTVFGAAAARGGPVINELSPRPAAGEGEWFELANPDPVAARLAGWSVHDATGRKRLVPEVTLEPGAYLVLAARPESLRLAFGLPDSVTVLRPDGWPTLNDNDGSGGAPADVIVLTDAGGVVVDSVAYHRDWLPPEKGRSLERADPRLSGLDPGVWGWTEDPRGGTPGIRNSLTGDDGLRGEGVLIGPDVVEPRRRPAVFSYRLPGAGVLAFTLVDPDGRRVAVLRPAAEAPAVGRWVWGSGSDLPRRPGPYRLCLRWQEPGTRRGVRTCRTVWVEP